MVELLAPAGNMDCFYAAINGGADAIYLAGEKYGARAYAGNFSKEELLSAISIAHLYGKKIYLTINTLLKENELNDLISYLNPYYEAGLHGVIVQDLGAMTVIKRSFPGLELHASTQMTVTGAYGASFLKSLGICRVVPARELSLSEIKQIKKETGLEIECFIHGAMCYSYSGQCLFSSMLGARSGNRGRCAGPCRLPYDVFYDDKQINKKNENYQLGLKDLCTIEILPELIEAGIDSFKIEGRMKSPSYVYFVTNLYRKYIDLYTSNPKSYKVKKVDLEQLRDCYSRGDVQSGYYKQHNGRNMVTLFASGYSSSSEFREDILFDNYAREIIAENKCQISGYFTANKEMNMSLTVLFQDESVYLEGDKPSIATKHSATKEDIDKQLKKTGNTPFVFSELEIVLEDGLFIPNKSLNELRRNALLELENNLITKFRRTAVDNNTCKSQIKELVERNKPSDIGKRNYSNLGLELSFTTLSQLKAFVSELTSMTSKQIACIQRVYLSYDMFILSNRDDNEVEKLISLLKKADLECILRMPAVARKVVTDALKDMSISSPFDGVCINNLELLEFFKVYAPNLKRISDSRFYCFQPQTAEFMECADITEHVLSYELHHSEIASMVQDDRCINHHFILPVYGLIPMIESAGCVLKTNQLCQKEKNAKKIYLLDRYQKKLPVITHCDRCENTIYNSVVLSLHREMDKISQLGIDRILLDFTVEEKKDVLHIIKSYLALALGEQIGDIVSDYTKGHFLKGVE